MSSSREKAKKLQDKHGYQTYTENGKSVIRSDKGQFYKERKEMGVSKGGLVDGISHGTYEFDTCPTCDTEYMSVHQKHGGCWKCGRNFKDKSFNKASMCHGETVKYSEELMTEFEALPADKVSEWMDEKFPDRKKQW